MSDVAVLFRRKRATIPAHILDPLFLFMRYTLLGSFHLNNYAAGAPPEAPVLSNTIASSNKRKRIVERLSIGLTGAKRRRFPLSRLNESLGDISLQAIENQLGILETHVIVTCPTRRTVELVRRLSDNAQNYLVNSCGYSQNDLIQLIQAISQLTD